MTIVTKVHRIPVAMAVNIDVPCGQTPPFASVTVTGPTGPQGPVGPQGPIGVTGLGVADGGDVGAVLVREAGSVTSWLTTTAFGRGLLAIADAAGLRSAAGLSNVDNTSDASKPVSTAQALAISAAVASEAGTRAAADTALDGRIDVLEADPITATAVASGLAGKLAIASNLSDLNNASTARTNLGLGSLATQSGTFSGTSSGTNTGDQTIALTGDVTGSGSGSFAATVAANAITNAKAAQMAAGTIKGNNTGATANASDLTAAQVRGVLALPTSTVAGRLARYTDTAGTQGSTTGLFEAANGNVGIGTTGPDEILEVGGANDTASDRKAIKFGEGGWGVPSASNATSYGDKLLLYYGSGFKAAIGFGVSNEMWFTSSAGLGTAKGFSFYTGSTGAAVPTEKVTILNSGNVGIGPTSPVVTLDVNGPIRNRSAYTVATLPAASLGNGIEAYVTDSTLAANGNLGTTVTGGGANNVKVRSLASAWIIAGA